MRLETIQAVLRSSKPDNSNCSLLLPSRRFVAARDPAEGGLRERAWGGGGVPFARRVQFLCGHCGCLGLWVLNPGNHKIAQLEQFPQRRGGGGACGV